MQQSKPNILIVMVDQLNPSFLRLHGHPLVKTPHLDALAARGMVFDKAYCNSPLCSPSRTALMTGSLPSRTGGYDNAAEFRSDLPTFAHYLRRLGYDTILSGKMHFCGPDQMHGFEERLTTDIYPADYGWTPDWDRARAHPLDRLSWYDDLNPVVDAGLCVRTSQIEFDEEVVFSAERSIHEYARGRRNRPFLMVASFNSPHDPYAAMREYWDLYDHALIDMPRVEMADVALDAHTRRLRHMLLMNDEQLTEEQIRNARHAYYGSISFCDYHLGRLLSTLKKTGLQNDTVVLFFGDHGEMLGERGLWYKMTFFEGAARVPLVAAGPGIVKGRFGGAVSLIDILPTLVDLAGGDSTRDLATPVDGRSLLPQLSGRGGHDEVLGEYLAEGVVFPLVMIRRGPYKFLHAPGDPDQLYDLETDPDEKVNLAEEARLGDVVAMFRTDVAKHWDLDAIDREVRLSQHRRLLVDSALTMGATKSWDFQPYKDASRQYLRNGLGIENRSMDRFPPVRP